MAATLIGGGGDIAQPNAVDSAVIQIAAGAGLGAVAVLGGGLVRRSILDAPPLIQVNGQDASGIVCTNV